MLKVTVDKLPEAHSLLIVVPSPGRQKEGPNQDPVLHHMAQANSTIGGNHTIDCISATARRPMAKWIPEYRAILDDTSVAHITV